MAEYTISFEEKKHKKKFEYSDITDTLDSFHERDFSTNDIFQITLWKIDRYPFVNDDTLKKLNSLRTKISLDEEKTKDVLMNLLNTNGVGLPMASTYLRFLNPKVYQIIDVRAYRAAFYYEPEHSYVYAKKEHQITVYIEYLKQLQKIAKDGYLGAKVDFKDLDRFLYDVDKISGYSLNETPILDKDKLVDSICKLMESN